MTGNELAARILERHADQLELQAAGMREAARLIRSARATDIDGENGNVIDLQQAGGIRETDDGRS